MKHLHFSLSILNGKAKLITRAKPSSTFLNVQANFSPSACTSMALRYWDKSKGVEKRAFSHQPMEIKVKRTKLGRRTGFCLVSVLGGLSFCVWAAKHPGL